MLTWASSGLWVFLREAMQQLHCPSGWEDFKASCRASFVASCLPAMQCPTCGTGEIHRPKACTAQSCVGTPGDVYGCTSIVHVFVPPTYSLALHPPPSGVNTIRWSPGDSDYRLVPDLSSLCALRVPLSGSVSFQPSAIVTWQCHKAVPPDHGSPSSCRGEYLEPGPQEPQRKIGSSLCHQYCPL